MPNLPDGFSLRLGTAGELETLVAIDNDASSLFECAGLHLDAVRDLEVTRAARVRWQGCLAAGTTLVAVSGTGELAGFAALGRRDRQPFLDQLAVRTAHMGKGVGTQLLYAAVAMATAGGGSALWLTTYRHLSWNRAYYERHGFLVMTDASAGPEVRAELSFERQLLPHPGERVPMRRSLGSG